jgi:hypothetical protein
MRIIHFCRIRNNPAHRCRTRVAASQCCIVIFIRQDARCTKLSFCIVQMYYGTLYVCQLTGSVLVAWGEGAEAVAIACNVMQVATASTPEVAIIVVTYLPRHFCMLLLVLNLS